LLPPGDLGEDPRGARTAADDRLGGGCLRPGARRGGARARGAALPAHRRAGSGRVIDAHDGVTAALGIDPHQAATAEAGRIDQLRELLTRPSVVAVGETGLDGHYGADTLREQRVLFEVHLALAEALGLPVVIHSRAASVETAAVLALFPGTVVLHCFSEPDLLDPALERGYYVSFAGNVTYPKADGLRAAAACV